ncbi:hypothetical protein GCM10023310_70340 [Paenibacillus vulneris]
MREMQIKRISPTNITVRPSDGSGIFHDSRSDIRILAEAINTVINKQNELIEKINLLIESHNSRNTD